MEETIIPPRTNSGETIAPAGSPPDDAETLREFERFRAGHRAIREKVLYDEQGEIPWFPRRRAFDDQGQYIPMSPEEEQARVDAHHRYLQYRREHPVEEPPGLDEAIMRGIDSHRPEGSKLFEGYY